jgi:amino acid transporter/nucleotide-binding universal stress UspA family protein
LKEHHHDARVRCGADRPRSNEQPTAFGPDPRPIKPVTRVVRGTSAASEAGPSPYVRRAPRNSRKNFMSEPENPTPPSNGNVRRALKTAPVIIVGSVMFSFISYWRVAAVVLCDMASTAFYIGGIAEQVVGAAAPWFILAVMIFSFAMGFVYIESCSLFVRGGVYRVVKEAIGGFPAKAAVSALLFDYILTGPISSVSAGSYLMGWLLEFIALTNPSMAIEDPALRQTIKQYGAMVIAVLITLYFFRKNLKGMHESSEKALKIVLFTTVVAVIVLLWSGLTLITRGPVNTIPTRPDLSMKVEYEVVTQPHRLTGEIREQWRRDEAGRLVPRLGDDGEPLPRVDAVTGRQVDPLGFMPHLFPKFSEDLREVFDQPGFPWNLLGLIGLAVAFGHSILAMSGEETMAQVYREVESPKLPNFKKAAIVIFTYAAILTTSVSMLAVLLIPDEFRMKDYADNLLGGLAMHVVGPPMARLILNFIVVVAGFLILSGAVNTSIIGSNGVLNRVAEDGVLPAALQKPHRKYGTTHRILYLVVGLQLLTIVGTGGNMILLGEAYAFGVIWSFLFMSLSMLVLRFKRKEGREFKVWGNIRLGSVEIPVGLSLVFLVLACSGLVNLFTKEVATISGLSFTAIFLSIFLVTERMTVKRNLGRAHEHIEQVTERSASEVSPETIGVSKRFRKLVAIRSPQNLYMLQRALEETDPETTEVIVMTAKTSATGEEPVEDAELDRYDLKLMTAVIELSEKVGKQIKPLVVPTNNPLYAVMNTARSLGVQELVVGASNKYTAEEHLDQMAFYWISLHSGESAPLSIRVLSRTWDVNYDIGGGNRIPRISELRATTVAELRAAGVGVRRVIMAHDNTPRSADLFDSVVTMLDPQVTLDLAVVSTAAPATQPSVSLAQDLDQAKKIGREIHVHELKGDPGAEIVRLALENDYDLIVLDGSADDDAAASRPVWHDYVREHSPCTVCVLSVPAIPREVMDLTPAAGGLPRT